MKNLMRIVIIAMLSFVGFSVSAQSSTFSNNVNGGISVPMLDGGYGLQVGFNSAYHITKRFAVEGALSYQNINITHSFLQGEQSKENHINALAGGRFYFSSEERKTRIYMNALFGGRLMNESSNNSDSTEFLGATSIGLYASRNKLLGGIAVESPGVLTLRIGYNF